MTGRNIYFVVFNNKLLSEGEKKKKNYVKLNLSSIKKRKRPKQLNCSGILYWGIYWFVPYIFIYYDLVP